MAVEEVVTAVRIEPWQKPHWQQRGSSRVLALALLGFSIFLLIYLLILTDALPLRFALNPRLDAAQKVWVVTHTYYSVEHFDVREGDSILLADRQPLQNADQIEFAKELVLQHPAGEPFTLSKAQVLDNWESGRGAYFVFGFLAAIYFWVSLWIYLLARQRVAAVLFFVSCTSLALAFICSVFVYRGYSFFDLLQVPSAMTAFVAFLHFFVIFPDNTPLPTIPVLKSILSLRKLLYLGYGTCGLAVLLLSLGQFFPTLHEAGQELALSQLSLTALGLVGLVLLKAFNVRTEKARAELFVIAATVFLTIVPFLLLSWLPSLIFGANSPQIDSIYLLGLFVLLPFGFAYAIVQYQSFGIRNFLQRRLAYFLIAFGIFLFYAGVLVEVFANYRFLQDSLPLELAVFLGLSLLIPLALNLLQARLQKFIDRVLFHDVYDYQTVMQNLTLELTQIQTLEEVSKTVLNRLNSLLNLGFASLVLYQQPKTDPAPGQVYYQKTLRHTDQSYPGLQVQIPVAATLRLPSPDRLHVVWNETGEQPLVAIEVPVKSFYTAVLSLGAKLSEESINQADVALIETLSGLLQVKLENALLIDELEHKVEQLELSTDELRRNKDELQIANERVLQISEEERIGLARELHDDPLQKLMLVLRQFDLRDETVTTREQFVWQINQEVSNTLRTICFNLRPPILDDLGLIPTLESLTLQIRSNAPSLEVELSVEPALENQRLSPEVEVVLYRVAQEALQNILKHAHAQQVKIELYQQDGALVLAIEDNGQGFQAPIDPNRLLRQGHLGLVGMYERLSSIGGKLEIRSRPGQGTHLEAIVESPGRRNECNQEQTCLEEPLLD